MKGIIKLTILVGLGYLAWDHYLAWHIFNKPTYEIHAKRIAKDNHYIQNYLVPSCSGPYCNHTYEWQGGGVAGNKVGQQSQSGTGTATAISAKGHWLTARHVVDGCDKVKLRVDSGKEIYAHKVRLHPEKDLALLYSEPADVPYLPIARKSPPQYATGYVSGFPAGRSGVLYLNLLGSNKYRHGNADAIEYTFIWSLDNGLGAHRGALFGFSGSSILNRNGEIVSVLQGYSKAYASNVATATSTLASVHELTRDIPELEEQRNKSRDLELSDDNFFRVGKELRKQYTVALVTCEAGI